jgi:hypothetical protein
MKKILLMATLLWFSRPAQASPITWRFTGIANSPSQYNSASIAGLNFELRIFLDTNLLGQTGMLADVFFSGPHQGVVELTGLGVLPVNNFANVQYFAPGGLVTGVQFNQPAFSDIMFASSISSDSLHLTPIAPVAPIVSDNTLESGVFGPNGLALFGTVTVFSATAEPQAVPEGSSTASLLVVGLIAIQLCARSKMIERVRP